MTKLKAAQFRDLCSSVQYAIDSLASCLVTEVPRERATLERAINELSCATLVRRNADCEEYREMMLRRGGEALETAASRLEIRRIDLEIEAYCRAEGWSL